MTKARKGTVTNVNYTMMNTIIYRPSLNFTCYPTDVLFPVHSSIQDPTLHFFALTPLAPLIWVSTKSFFIFQVLGTVEDYGFFCSILVYFVDFNLGYAVLAKVPHKR